MSRGGSPEMFESGDDKDEYTKHCYRQNPQKLLGELDGELLKAFGKFTPELLTFEVKGLKCPLLQKASEEFFSYMQGAGVEFVKKVDVLIGALGAEKLKDMMVERCKLLEGLRPSHEETVGSWHDRILIQEALANTEKVDRQLQMNGDILGALRSLAPGAFVEKMEVGAAGDSWVLRVAGPIKIGASLGL